MDPTKFKATGPWVLVRADKPDSRTPGGLYLPDGNMPQRLGHLTGTVLSVGPGEFAKGKEARKYKYIPHDLKVGDKVMFRGFLKEANQPFDDKDLCLIHINDVVGVAEAES